MNSLVDKVSHLTIFLHDDIGYDTASHVAEETDDSHHSTPVAMIGSVINCIFLGILLIVGMNYCIQDIDSLIDPLNPYK